MSILLHGICRLIRDHGPRHTIHYLWLSLPCRFQARCSFPSKWTDIKIYFVLFPKSLDARGLIGIKCTYFKPLTFALWSPHKEHTESAICKEHLAPCRFKCWTNLYSIGSSQPLAQLQSRNNIEILRVSLHVRTLKWDFRTDSHDSPGIVQWIFHSIRRSRPSERSRNTLQGNC